MNNLSYIGRVENGKLILSDRKGFDEDLKSFEGERVELSLKKYRKKRSDRQNKFYFSNFLASQIDCFYENWGQRYDKETMHLFNKSKFWAEEHVDEGTGEIIKIPCSSKDYSTIEWEERLDIARQWFLDKFNWTLPYPEQQTDLNL